ncbi:MAG: hypothetical protein JSV98_04370 [candidate division WOR-3 bacterium]|nr:MAG: hypothetical protein JSV98_04370 [candidate division WOR-3 bacterium]
MKVEKIIVAFVILGSCILLLQCGTVSSVKPMGTGGRSIAFSAGGPVAPVFDMDIPLPYSVLRYRFGLNDNTDIHIGIHPTMALFGNLAIDAGLTRHFTRSLGMRPGVSAGLAIYGFYDFVDLSHMRVYPEISLIFSYDIFRSSHVVYLGGQGMIQFAEPYIVPALTVGGEFSLGKSLALSLETRWYAPTESSDDRVVDFKLRPFDQGALGFVLGLGYKL